MNYKETAKWAGMILLAVIGAQILNGILFYLLSYGMQREMPPELASVLFLLPGLLAALGGGYFLGRLLPDSGWGFWGATGVLNAAMPVLFQVLSGGGWEWATDLMTLSIVLGTALIWTVGGRLGRLDFEKRPSESFDRMLLRITGGGVGIVVLLYAMSWGSIHFSKGYRQAKNVEIPLPPDVTEEPGRFADPRVAAGRRFTWDAPALDKHVFEFYQDAFKNKYIDVTKTYQEHDAGEWFHVRREVRDQVYDYYASGAHWRDSDRSVLISLVMQAERADPDQPWEEGTWHITGVVVAQAYAEPPPPTPVPSPSAAPGTAAGKPSAAAVSISSTPPAEETGMTAEDTPLPGETVPWHAGTDTVPTARPTGASAVTAPTERNDHAGGGS